MTYATGFILSVIPVAVSAYIYNDEAIPYISRWSVLVALQALSVFTQSIFRFSNKRTAVKVFVLSLIIALLIELLNHYSNGMLLVSNETEILTIIRGNFHIII